MWHCKVWQKTADIIVPLAVVVNNLGRGPGAYRCVKLHSRFTQIKTKVFTRMFTVDKNRNVKSTKTTKIRNKK